jgi:hypothetical protein
MAGVVALLLAANPALSPTQVKSIVRRSCARIDATNGKYDSKGHSHWYGYGRIDAGKAVENALKAKKTKVTTKKPKAKATVPKKPKAQTATRAARA